MKFYNHTQRKEHHRCPRRYYFRYLHRPGTTEEVAAYGKRRQLYGIRELGGHLIHREVASMVRWIADGNHSWDYEAAGNSCAQEFRLIVAKSLATEPGELIEGLQLAETFNGVCASDLKDDVNHWTTLIPIAIENAFRAAHELGIRNETSEYKIETEKEIFWTKGGRTYRYILDVLIQSRYQTICIDWKSHEIDHDDATQVRNYLSVLHHRNGVPASKLFGFAVDLFHDHIQNVPFEPYRVERYRSSLPNTTSPRSTATHGDDHSFPANPHAELCLRCPYASLCPESFTTTARQNLVAV